MDVNLLFKIAAVGILVTILSQVLKHSGREEHAFLLSLAALILVLSWIVPYCSGSCHIFMTCLIRLKIYFHYKKEGSIRWESFRFRCLV